ncbi:MAG: PQQ-binding-like beta-propeller repeat protein [Kordiimonadaceae bacterium]|jgi:quinoprotein glucose dehydrogenase|nr:PQQ-binding-like beta-propeller repeat protein [Kordiimonadaceae bacterium]MBT6037046.1 PQQ-binding-like beta-propeller repeat protein [Kordiimonadaceae bacterium]MBT6328897.1 PQQ-binding-like beta-propeller repeat protein [Kordiimonadaceae bacterium]
MKNKLFTSVALFMVFVFGIFAHADEPGTAGGEWHQYTGDLKGSRYSPLDQINADNFADLELVWSFDTKSLGSQPEFLFELTPLMIDGVIYGTGGTRRAAYALDAGTGELMWLHSMREGLRAGLAPRQLSGRGLSYWSDGNGDDRIYYVTTGYKLVALDAHTGIPINSFGTDGNGILDLKIGVVHGNEVQIDLMTGEVGLHSTPTVVRNLIIVGSSMRSGLAIDNHDNTKGLVRAFDVLSGKLVWQFDPIPRPGSFGNETWLDNSWENNGNTGVWTQITVDEKNELVFLGVESPSSDYYGGHRPGDNLFGDSLVAVDLNTGEYRWHFQFVHHPIWDHDVSSAPLLMDVEFEGEKREIVAQPMKQGMLYVFDRLTGEPIWPIPEVAVPAGDVPGEWYSPTQPRPRDEFIYGRPELDVENGLIDFTPELKAKALKRLEKWDWEGATLYNPPILGDINGIMGAIAIGNATGGTNWPGGAFDPETGIVYLPASTSQIGSISLIAPTDDFSNLDYVGGRIGQPLRISGAGGAGQNPDAPKSPPPPPSTTPTAVAPTLRIEGLPILKPPYGIVAAIDLNTGEPLWRIAHGETPDNVRNHPKLAGLDIPRTGQGADVGMVITKTLAIIGDPFATSPGDRERGGMLRAYNKMTGVEVGEVWMPSGQSGSPMTYMLNGKQYIVVAVSGGNYGGELLAYALPDD